MQCQMHCYYAVLLSLALILPGTLTLGAEPEDIKLPPKEQFHLFLLAGQSNMAGRGTVEPQDRQVNPRVLMLSKDGRWVPAVDPMHFDKPSVVGVGLGRTFGFEIAATDPTITIGLIPCAVGGSPISSWEPGGYHGQTKNHPFDDAVKRTRLALESGVLKGILWHQGESDSQEGKAEIYERKLHALIARFRETFQTPNVPFVAGQMGQFPERPWNDSKHRVDQAHRDLAQKVPHCAFVTSDGLDHRGDHVHFSSKSYREFGSRYARAFRDLRQQ